MMKMNVRSFLGLFCLLILTSFSIVKMDRSTIYGALAGNSEASIDVELSRLDGEQNNALVNAYKGALRMKKAAFVKGPPNKLKMFKSGAHLLEEKIKEYPTNPEFRFLRLLIQEHAPKILKYNKNLDEDKKLIIDGFNKLEPDLKAVVKNYAAGSKIIHTDDLQ